MVTGWQVADIEQSKEAAIAIEWFNNKLNKTIAVINDHFDKFRLSDSCMTIYKLFWDDFCAWYLEAIKPAYGAPIDRKSYDATIEIFDKLLKLLHPYMPFITEELWQNLQAREDGETIMLQMMPNAAEYDEKFIEDFELTQQAIVAIRALRQSKNISPKESLELKIKGAFNPELSSILEKLANISSVEVVSDLSQFTDGQILMVGTVEFFVPLAGMINVEEEIAKAKAEIVRYKKFYNSVNVKLSNERFVANAPAAVVELERKKLSDAQTKIENLEKVIENLTK